MSETTAEIEKFFCNKCKQKTNHFVRAKYERVTPFEEDGTSLNERHLVIECCGCEYIALVRKTHFSEHVEPGHHPITGEEVWTALWDEEIYPPLTYRTAPPWFEDLPDATLRDISSEIYKALQTGSHYLAAFGSRTLIDRLIVLTVGDKGNFGAGLKALKDEGKISESERDVLKPVVEAGNAAAHRGWAPGMEQLETILDTVEGLIHRLLVLPKLTEELEDAVPPRDGKRAVVPTKKAPTTLDKVRSAPAALRAVYDDLEVTLKGLGGDVTMHPQKHYIAFRRNRNFASVQIYNRKKVIRLYLNLDPDGVNTEYDDVRDVRQIGHFGTGDFEVTIKSKKDIPKIADLIKESYDAS